MKLSELLAGAEIVRQDADPSLNITSLAFDSRRAGPGGLFAAIPGFKLDGHDFVPKARDAGAAAVLTERWLEDARVPQVQTGSVRRTIALAAANFYEHPSGKIKLVGVTGTNGKTTTTFLIDSILRTAGKRTGLLGGIEYRLGGEPQAAARTTPESIDLQKMLSVMISRNVEAATIEVSSHGIELFRVAYLNFAVAVLTNLTRDHLDLHHDMESYYQIKRRLFTGEVAGKPGGPDIPRPYAVINTDDESGARLFKELLNQKSQNVLDFGVNKKTSVRAINIKPSGWQTSFDLKTPSGSVPVILKLPGEFNVYNALAAAATAYAMGIPLMVIADGLGSSGGAPGRFEPVAVNEPYKVVVDYAHNEDGLAKAIATARSLTAGKVIVVFGCPGERDREKRPGMGRIAGSQADVAILTTDDCYEEPPDQILDQTEPGLIDSGGEYLRVAARRDAIEKALSVAREGDTVLIAGKGHETRQIMAGGPEPFNDKDVVLEILASR